MKRLNLFLITMATVGVSTILGAARNINASNVGNQDQSQVIITSPDDTLQVVLNLSDTGELTYVVNKGSDLIIDTSKLGIRTFNADFTTGLLYNSITQEIIDETYSLIQYDKESLSDHCREAKILYTKDGNELLLVFRVYNDGIAYRYIIPGEGQAIITEELSEFNLPDGTGGWAFQWRSDYEGLYEYYGPNSFNGSDFAMPALFSLNNNKHWMLLTEGNVYNADGTYCASHLLGTSGEILRVVFAPEQTTSVITSYPFQTPYRIAVITDNLNDLVRTDIINNVNPESEILDTSFVNPGKAAWSWWSEERSPQWYTRQQDYVDFAAANGWEYVTVDAGWDDSWIQSLCEYAEPKGVSVLIWTDIGALDTAEKINDRLPLWASWGAKGIKIDFMMDDSQSRMLIYDLITRKGAELNLLINFHASVRPGGEMRTWQNIITTEAVRGSEHYKWSDYTTAYQNCSLPFTRNVLGPMDFTPVVISNANLNTTHAHQLALSVVFESGIQHFADSIDSYESWKGLSFLNAVPVTWDDTQVMEGFPGDFVTIARRSGEDWYIGSITDEARTATIPLSFLDSGTYNAYIYKDGSLPQYIEIDQEQVTKDSILSIPVAGTGGCAIIITKGEHQTGIISDPSYTYYEAEAEGNTMTEDASVILSDNSSGGEKVGNLGGSRQSTLGITNIVTQEAGNYRLKIFYLSGEERNLTIRVNDKEGVRITCPSSGSFQTIRTTTVDVALESGNNTIYFSDSGYAPDIDRIGIKRSEPVVTRSYEAESSDNYISSGARIEDESSASGGKKVTYLGMGEYMTFNNVEVDQSGTYIVRIYYMTEGNRNLYIRSGEGQGQPVICFDSGGFDQLEYKDTFLNLNSGSNQITIYNDTEFCPDIDKIIIMPIRYN